MTEKIARDEMSRMIGEKVIGKVFADNLAEFHENKNFDSIVEICSIISKILVLLKELDSKQRAQIEQKVLYRSNILHILYKYLSKKFSVQSFPPTKITEGDKVIR